MSKKSRKSKYCVSTQVFVSLLALVLVMGVAVGGTIAWLTDSTPEVKNTFTVGDINITLTETWNTDADKDGTNDSWSAQLIPGFTYKKDPVVTVSDDSVDCYLFVKFDEKNTPSVYLDYHSALTEENGWTLLSVGADAVYYREVNANDTTRSWNLLENDKIMVRDGVNKESMADAAKAELVYTAYACQLYKAAGEKFTAAEAWAKVSGSAN